MRVHSLPRQAPQVKEQLAQTVPLGLNGEGAGKGGTEQPSMKSPSVLPLSVSMEMELESPGVSFSSAWTTETSKQGTTRGAEVADAGPVQQGKEQEADDVSLKSAAPVPERETSPELVELAEDIEEALGQVSSMVATEASTFGLIGSLTPAVRRSGPSTVSDPEGSVAASGEGFAKLQALEATQAPIEPAAPSEVATRSCNVAPAGLHGPAPAAAAASRIPSAPRPQHKQPQQQLLPSRIPGLTRLASQPSLRLSKSADMAHDIDIFLRSIVGASEATAKSRDPSPQPDEASAEVPETAVQEDAVLTASVDVETETLPAPSMESDVGNIMDNIAGGAPTVSEVEETAETGLSISVTVDCVNASPVHEEAERDEGAKQEEALSALCIGAPVSGEDVTASDQTAFSDAFSKEVLPVLLDDPEVPEAADEAPPSAESIAAVASGYPDAQKEAEGYAQIPRTKTETRKRDRFGTIAISVASLLITLAVASLVFALCTQPLMPDLQQGFGIPPAGLRNDKGAQLRLKEDFTHGSAVDGDGEGRALHETPTARHLDPADDGTGGEGGVADFIGELKALIEFSTALKETDFSAIVDSPPSEGSNLALEEVPAASGTLETLLESWDRMASQVGIPGVSDSHNATTSELDPTTTSSVAKWLSGTERHFCTLHEQMEEGLEMEEALVDETLLPPFAASDSLVAPAEILEDSSGASAEAADQQKRQEVAKGLLDLLAEVEVLAGDGSALNEMWPVMAGAALETADEEAVEEHEVDPTEEISTSSSAEELSAGEPQKQLMGICEACEALTVKDTDTEEATPVGAAVGTVLEDSEPAAVDPELTLHAQEQHKDGEILDVTTAEAAEMHHDAAAADGAAVEAEEQNGDAREGLLSSRSIRPQKGEEHSPLDFEEALSFASRVAVQALQMCLQCGLAAVVTRILARGTAFGRRRGRVAHTALR